MAGRTDSERCRRPASAATTPRPSTGEVCTTSTITPRRRRRRRRRPRSAGAALAATSPPWRCGAAADPGTRAAASRPSSGTPGRPRVPSTACTAARITSTTRRSSTTTPPPPPSRRRSTTSSTDRLSTQTDRRRRRCDLLPETRNPSRRHSQRSKHVHPSIHLSVRPSVRPQNNIAGTCPHRTKPSTPHLCKPENPNHHATLIIQGGAQDQMSGRGSRQSDYPSTIPLLPLL